MIYTIGTSNRSLAEFMHELRRRNITQMIDVRASPYSRTPEFNAGQIVKWSARAGILYRQDGAVLGGRSPLAIDNPDFIMGLDRLLSAGKREHVAMFCAEGDPRDCHRSYHVGAALHAFYGVAVQNILRDGSTEDIRSTLHRTPPKLLDPYVGNLLKSEIGSPQGSLL